MTRFSLRELFATARNLRTPERAWALALKIIRRLSSKNGAHSAAMAQEWCVGNCGDAKSFMVSLDPALHSEAEIFTNNQALESERKLKSLPFLGGGGHATLLYFVTRLIRPAFVVETGVAAGHSTSAILGALARNEKGLLFSSDLPYYRIDEPELYIGVLVDDVLKGRWFLALDGDRKNLRHLPRQFKKIDILHYDSDKSYQGRKSAFRLLERHLHADTLIVMDDIQDNMFFADYVRRNRLNFHVFSLKSKFVGLAYKRLPLISGANAVALAVP